MRKSDGSIIFLILIAIFLFGALTYMYLKSSRTTDYLALEEDKAALYAGEVLNYANAIKEGIARIKLLHGYKDYEIDVYTGAENYVIGSANTTCTSNKCKLFHPEGGAVKPRAIHVELLQRDKSFFVGEPMKIEFKTLEIYNAGIADADELILLIKGLHIDICRQIRYKLYGTAFDTVFLGEGISNAANFATTLTSFPDTTESIVLGDNPGKRVLCFSNGFHGQNFIFTLLER